MATNVRLRYKRGPGFSTYLESTPIVIGIQAYKVILHDDRFSILNADTGQYMFKSESQPSGHALKRNAKKKLVEMGATFMQEVRNKRRKE